MNQFQEALNSISTEEIGKGQESLRAVLRQYEGDYVCQVTVRPLRMIAFDQN